MVSFHRRRLPFVVIACLSAPASGFGQVVALSEAVREATSANRSIQVAALVHEQAQHDIAVAKTQRLPVFSITALGSQPLTQLGVTLERGSLGVYPFDGPIPGQTTTLTSPLR